MSVTYFCLLMWGEKKKSNYISDHAFWWHDRDWRKWNHVKWGSEVKGSFSKSSLSGILCLFHVSDLMLGSGFMVKLLMLFVYTGYTCDPEFVAVNITVCDMYLQHRILYWFFFFFTWRPYFTFPWLMKIQVNGHFKIKVKKW